jgi:hypothetical protein
MGTTSKKTIGELCAQSLNRLAKWRSIFAGWQLGTRSMDDGECLAVRDHREVTIMLRAEVNALTAMLIQKGVFSADEFQAILSVEADDLSEHYSRKFAGARANDDGIEINPQIWAETIKRLKFPS